MLCNVYSTLINDYLISAWFHYKISLHRQMGNRFMQVCAQSQIGFCMILTFRWSVFGLCIVFNLE